MPVVAMPDGAHVSFPDDMPEANIRSLILQKFPQTAPSPSPDGAFAGPPAVPAPAANSMLDTAKQFGSGLVEGTQNLNPMEAVSAMGDLAGRGALWAANKIAPNNDIVKQFQGAMKALDNLAIPPEKDPASITSALPPDDGSLARTMGRFGLPALASPGSPAVNALSGVGGAIGAHEAKQIAPDNPLGQVAGAVGGSLLPSLISRTISPGTVNEARQPAVQALKKEGVELPASMQTGSKALGRFESELGDAPMAGGKATAARDKALDTFTQATANKIPEFVGAKDLKPDTINEGFKKIGDKFNDVAARNPVIPLDKQFLTDFDQVRAEYQGLTGLNPTILDNLMGRLQATGVTKFKQPAFSGAPPVISGDAYQKVSSDLAEAIRSNPANGSLRDFKRVLDGAIQRNLADPKDREIWRQARSSYKDALILERAMKTTTEDASLGRLTPAKLTQGIEAIQKKGYTRGRSTFEPLARAGNAVMKDLPNSGTASRQQAWVLPAALSAAAGTFFAGHPFKAAGIAGIPFAHAAAGRVLMSKPMQRWLANQQALALRDRNPAFSAGILGSLPLRGQ